MSKFIIKRQFLNLINKFMKRRISADKFCSDFTKLWLRNRDLIYKQQEKWHEPYDQHLLDEWRRGSLTEQKFQQRWLALWRSTDNSQFNTMIDTIHSTCSVYNPQPEYEWELDNDEFFREVSQIVESKERDDSYYPSDTYISETEYETIAA